MNINTTYGQLLEGSLPYLSGSFYHGTTKEFDQFQRPKRYSPSMQLGFGIHATKDPNWAREHYANGPRGVVKKVRLRASKVLDVSKPHNVGTPEHAFAKELHGSRLITHEGPTPDSPRQFMIFLDQTHPKRAERLLRKHGFDAVKYNAQVTLSGSRPLGIRPRTHDAVSYVVLDPHQIEHHGVHESKEAEWGVHINVTHQNYMDITFRELVEALSDTEQEQLGQPTGKASHFVRHWDRVRAHFLNRSKRRNPHLNPELTAYTPGETKDLLKHPTISGWHEKMRTFTVPKGYDHVAFVPCAATKPWGNVTSNKSIYGSYNRIRQDVEAGKTKKRTYFVTISEPLGVVPQKHWNDFPQYDNPGLFKDHPQRAGMFTRDWKSLPAKHGGTGQRQVVPFDHAAYHHVIGHLGKVIGDFVNHNRKRNPTLKFVSFVDNPPGVESSTHTDMLDHAERHAGPFLSGRFTKRAKAREIPELHLRQHLNAV